MESKYITLKEASEYTPYDANYLGLLVRKKRLFAVKDGGRWYTTKSAINSYLSGVAEKAARQYDYSGSSKKIDTNPRLLAGVFAVLIIAFFVFMFAAMEYVFISDITSSEVPQTQQSANAVGSHIYSDNEKRTTALSF